MKKAVRNLVFRAAFCYAFFKQLRSFPQNPIKQEGGMRSSLTLPDGYEMVEDVYTEVVISPASVSDESK